MNVRDVSCLTPQHTLPLTLCRPTTYPIKTIEIENKTDIVALGFGFIWPQKGDAKFTRPKMYMKRKQNKKKKASCS